MKSRWISPWDIDEHLSPARHLAKWTAIALPVGVIIGCACALFLWLMEWATSTRYHNAWLLYLLPLAGIAIVASYRAAGKSVEKGYNLVLDEIHEPGGGVPLRVTPLILIVTVVTHLFGGSAGRESTAVQMGGSIASKISQLLRLTRPDARLLMMAGMAAGFGAVFGTPIAGAVFAMEVLTRGRIRYDAVGPCLVAAIAGDWACAAWGIHHTHFRIAPVLLKGLVGDAQRFNELLLAKVALAAMLFGLASFLFARMAEDLQRLFSRIKIVWLRPVVGACIIIALVHLLGTRDYLGLGVYSPHPFGVSILSSFNPNGADSLSWFWKILFTTLTLSSGFKGGEVTPLFFIGAALGNTLATLLHAPVDLLAAVGFVAVFAGAANTPMACTIMGMELFGADFAIYFAIGCFGSYMFSGRTGIYSSQRVEVAKGGLETS